MIRDVSEADFQANVLDRSRSVPVVVDFWAAWCGPCRALTPALERAAGSRDGRVDLAKVDVDRNQRLAQAFRVQGIPAVKAFRDGRVAAEFTGALPPEQVEAFFDRLVPSEAEIATEQAIAARDEPRLRESVAADPRNAPAALALARLLLARGDDDEALELLEPLEADFLAAGLRARVALARERPELADAFGAWDDGDHRRALDALQDAFHAETDAGVRDLLRQTMIGIFTELGPGDPLASEHRRRLAAALN